MDHPYYFLINTVNGGVKAQVARYLNDNKVPTPLAVCRPSKGKMKRWKYAEEEKFWSGAIVGE